MTWYPEEFTKQVAITDMHMRPNSTSGNPGRSHRFYTGTPVYKFGEGMSYSDFDSTITGIPKNISVHDFPEDLSLMNLAQHTVINITVNVTNLSELDGAHAVLLFAAPPDAGMEKKKETCGF